MKIATKFLATLAITATLAAPAYAWGPREQGVLAGIAGVLLLQHATHPRVVVPHAGYYPTPQPVVPYYPGTVYHNHTYRPMYKAVDVFIPECNCYRTVTVQVN